jgi:hypothetical protein
MCCSPGSICFEMLKGVPAAVVTLIIGGIAGAVTWRQYKVAQAKLKLDLFERRFKIFQLTCNAASDTAREAPGRRKQIISSHRSTTVREGHRSIHRGASKQLDCIA